MKKFSVTVMLIFALVCGNLALAQNHPFTDTFDDASLAQWNRGSNSGATYVKTVSVNGQNVLELQSQLNQSGWLISKNNYLLRNSTVTMKIVTANKDGDLGICPTNPPPGNLKGIDIEQNWYRFYVGPDTTNQAPPYGLYVTKKNDGTKEDLKKVGNLSAPFHIRMRFDDYKIYFEYSTNNQSTWNLLHAEFFDLPGYTLDDRFYYEIAATNTAYPNNTINGKLQVDDFATAPINSTIEKEILVDSLTDSIFSNGANDPNQSLKIDRTYVGLNSNFSASGWKPTADADLVRYDLGRYLEKGSLEIKVIQFAPNDNQNKEYRHHVLAMFRMPWGGHHVVEDLETDWDLHTGRQYSNFDYSGVKLYSVTHFYNQTQFDDKQSVTPLFNPDYALQHDWSRSTQYTIKLVWSDKSVAYYRNKVLQKAEDAATGIISEIIHSHTKDFELRYVYVGRDRTVSGDSITNYNGEYGSNGNQYRAMWSNGQNSSPVGPIYSEIKVKEIVSSADVASPTINILSPTTYVNGGRLSWTTTELTVCYVNYGTTVSYGSKTPVLGPPSSSYSTLLSNLVPNQTYHYQIVAVDNAGNRTVSGDKTFATQQSGTYVFKPVADTYIEQNNNVAGYSHLYGITRAFGNYGWMNLMTAKGRICYLKFDVTGVTGTINQALVQLYGRQGGSSGAKLKTFTPIAGHESDWEFNLTWNNRSTYIQSLNAQITSLNSVIAGQWHPLNVTTVVQGNGNYYFALEDSTGVDPVSFDSRESTNNQLELIISTTLFTDANISLPGIQDGDVAWGDYDKDGDLDLVITGLGVSGAALSKLYRNNNNGASFTEVDTLEALGYSAADWGDFDMDNDLDLLLAGEPTSGQVTQVYRNNNNNFVAHAAPSLIGIKFGDVAWGNYNHDRYLDILLSGQGSSSGHATKIYKNVLNVPNSQPSPPDTLYPAVYSPADSTYELKWSKSTDTETPQALTYNVMIGSTRNGFEIVSPISSKINGKRWIPAPGNAGTKNSYILNRSGLGTGWHYWRVQAVDNIFRGSNFSVMDSFNVASPAALAKNSVNFSDHFNEKKLSEAWLVKNNSSHQARIFNQQLRLASDSSQADWIMTQKPFVAQNTTVAVKVAQPDKGFRLGMSASYDSSAGINSAANFYRFEMQRQNSSGPYSLYAHWKKNGVDGGLDITGKLSIVQEVYLRLRFEASNIYFEASLDGNNWQTSYSEPFDLPDHTLAHSFHYELAAGQTHSANLVAVDDFSITNNDGAEISDNAPTVPRRFALSQNYPNPFNIATRVNLDLPENGQMKATIYNLQGQEVMRLRDDKMAAGYHFLYWDGKNAGGSVVSSGVYIVKIIFDGASGKRKEATQRVMLIK